jgi:signal transduction histidine kinase
VIITDKNILNRGVSESWDFDIKRAYRQVNAFSVFLFFIAASALPIALFFKVYAVFFVQLVSSIFYLLIYLNISNYSIKTIRNFSIGVYEIHIFLVSLFAISPTGVYFMPFYSPIFISYMLYPLVAALFDMPVFRHMGVAIAQIIIIQITGNLIITVHFPQFPEHNDDLLSIVASMYTIGMASLFVYLIYTENQAVKNLEIERSKQLEKLLIEVQLSKAKHKGQAKELKKLNDTKNKFFSVIAHDLKSPYNAVLGFAQVLKDKSIDNPEYFKFAKLIHDTALNSYNLLENLLEWSRSQLDQIKFEPCSTNLLAAINKNLELLQTIADQKNIKLQIRVNSNMQVWADDVLFSTIIRNLLTNAIKFTDLGGEISIAAREGTKNVEISVSDTGIGMSDDLVKRLFRIETKESRLGTQNEKGTGLGLLLCKEFVEMHGGKIWAESIEGSGTTFYITIPVA